MPPARKRENRGNQFYNVGEQGRKTGIRLEDKGVRDEYGMEPISGIFSSPEKSPPKRNAPRSSRTVTDSESMDIDDNTVPDLTPGHILHSNRPNLPPPRSRSPIKTALGSSPRRQSSMGARVQSINESEHSDRASSQPAVNRRLEFDQDESSLQETPALSGSGTRRGKARPDVYDLDTSPTRGHSAVLDESLVQEEIIAGEESVIQNDYVEESFVGAIGDDTIAGAEGEDTSIQIEESELVSEVVVKQPAKRGRKRKSDVLEPVSPEEPVTSKSRRKVSDSVNAEQTSTRQKGRKSDVAISPVAKPEPKPRGRPLRATRASDASVVENSIPEISVPENEDEKEEAPIAPTRTRGRPRKDDSKTSTKKPTQDPEFAKPSLPVKGKEKTDTLAKGKEKANAAAKGKGKAKKDTAAPTEDMEKLHLQPGKLVDASGHPLSKDDIDRMSTTSAGSRFGRGRSLSVYRLFGPTEDGTVGKTGRHRLQPVNFWLGEKAHYDRNGSLEEVVRNEVQELPKSSNTKRGRRKGPKRTRGVDDDDEEDEVLAEWEEKDGVFTGVYPQYDPVTGMTSEEGLLEDTIAWSEKGINLKSVADGGFSFQKLGSAPDSFMSWGFIGLKPDGQKRTKNTRRMHMCLHVTKGAVEATVDKNVFTVHKGGLWHVPRGNTYSIKNVANTESRIFFVQSFESVLNGDEQ